MSEITGNLTRHILIVDDEEHFRYGAAVALRKAGYKVSEAADGSTALSMICSRSNGDQFDLVLLDVQMPKLTGYDLLEVMRVNGFNIPVLFITGFADKEVISRLERMGHTDILNKPFAPDELVSRIEEKFGGPGYRRPRMGS